MSLINKKHVKEFALETAKLRAHKFTRIGSGFLAQCEGNLKTFIRGMSRGYPRKEKPSINPARHRATTCASHAERSWLALSI